MVAGVSARAAVYVGRLGRKVLKGVYYRLAVSSTGMGSTGLDTFGFELPISKEQVPL